MALNINNNQWPPVEVKMIWGSSVEHAIYAVGKFDSLDSSGDAIHRHFSDREQAEAEAARLNALNSVRAELDEWIASQMDWLDVELHGGQKVSLEDLRKELRKHLSN